MCFCKECRAPIPVSLASKATKVAYATGSENQILSNYVAATGPEVDRVHPFLLLEELFADRELEEHLQIQSLRLENLKFDLDEVQKNLNAKAQEKKNPNWALCERIEKGKKLLDKVKNHMLPQKNFEEFVDEALEARVDHWNYLDAIKSEAKKIGEMRDDYQTKINKIAEQLNKSIEASEDCAIPEKLRVKSSQSSVRLKFTAIEKNLKKIKKEKEGLAQSVISSYPSVTFPVGVLRSMKVISRMGEGVPEMAIKSMFLTFSASEHGDWEVQIVHMERRKKRVLRSFTVDTRIINSMQRAGKTAKIPFDDGFVVINAFNLLQLLARISAGSMN